MPHPAFHAPTPAPSLSAVLGLQLLDLFSHAAHVEAVEVVSDRFRLVTLGGDSTWLLDWVPGDRLQVRMAGAASRSYTPFTLDWTPGRLQLLGHTGGGGPGAAWLQGARAGAACRVSSLRRSVNLRRLMQPACFVGDETAFGLAVASRAVPREGPGIRFVFEVSDLAEARHVLARMGVAEAVLVQRLAGDAHLPDLTEAVLAAMGAEPRAQLVMAGKSTSLQHLRRALKPAGVPASALQVKAHWAPGKRGLD